MPHLTIEHSANVADRIDIDGLVDAVHTAALGTGIAPLDGLRTRAASLAHYAVGDRHPDNGFVAITARLGAGRSEADQRRLIETLMTALDEFVGDERQTLMLSVEFQEIDPAHRLNRNHLRPVIAARLQQTHDD